MWPNSQETADLVTFTEETLMENFIFCAVLVDVLENLHMSHIEGNTAKTNITARF